MATSTITKNSVNNYTITNATTYSPGEAVRAAFSQLPIGVNLTGWVNVNSYGGMYVGRRENATNGSFIAMRSDGEFYWISQINGDPIKLRTNTPVITQPSATITNHLAFVSPPTSNHYPIFVFCGDAIPRMIAGKNWDGNYIIYCPIEETGTFDHTVAWAEYI